MESKAESMIEYRNTKNDGWLIAMYEKAGFEIDSGPWLVHKPTAERLAEYAKIRRKALRGENR